jgi:RNA-dependent RNA polymerase
MILAELHSKAVGYAPFLFPESSHYAPQVDFSKSGQPVNFEDIPRFPAQCKPDWNRKAGTQSSTMYYQSDRVIGKLFRQVKLEEKLPRSTEQFSMDGEEPQDHPFFDILRRRLREVFSQELNFNLTLEMTARSGWEEELKRVLTKYQGELASIQALHSLSDQPLTEEEVFVGVILSQASERRLQDDLRARMRLITGVLVDRVLAALRGKREHVTVEQWVARTWLAWNWVYGSEEIGYQSFSWIAMLSFFDALEVHEGRRRDPAEVYQSPGSLIESEEIEGMVDEAGDEEEVSPLVE